MKTAFKYGLAIGGVAALATGSYYAYRYKALQNSIPKETKALEEKITEENREPTAGEKALLTPQFTPQSLGNLRLNITRANRESSRAGGGESTPDDAITPETALRARFDEELRISRLRDSQQAEYAADIERRRVAQQAEYAAGNKRRVIVAPSESNPMEYGPPAPAPRTRITDYSGSGPPDPPVTRSGTDGYMSTGGSPEERAYTERVARSTLDTFRRAVGWFS